MTVANMKCNAVVGSTRPAYPERYMKLLLSISLALAALSFVPSAVSADEYPIAVKQCFVTVPKALSQNASGTQIEYVNMTDKTISKVTFAVAYRNSATVYMRHVTDVGRFKPGALINHHFPLYDDVTYGGTNVRGCAVIAARFADGSHWSP